MRKKKYTKKEKELRDQSIQRILNDKDELIRNLNIKKEESAWIKIHEMPLWAEAILEIEGLVNEEVSRLKKKDDVKTAALLTKCLTVIKRGY
tara:strand:- start:749 stop:1024 length:276 start_codon:yes stop_codon:yes gene_type:complete